MLGTSLDIHRVRKPENGLKAAFRDLANDVLSQSVGNEVNPFKDLNLPFLNRAAVRESLENQ